MKSRSAYLDEVKNQLITNLVLESIKVQMEYLLLDILITVSSTYHLSEESRLLGI